MNVIALVDFHDNLRDVDRKRGEEFVVTSERFAEINEKGLASSYAGPFVEEIARDKAAQAGKETPESRAAKAPAKRRAARKAE